MIEIVINHDPSRHEYKIYEPTTDTLMASSNLTEALCMLNKFIESSGLSNVGNILDCPDISYHIDSATMKAMIESNISLLNRLRTAPSGFAASSQKFGGTTQFQQKMTQQKAMQGGSSQRKKNTMSSGFSSADGFRKSYKKFKNN
jgi:hypothetical protein